MNIFDYEDRRYGSTKRLDDVDDFVHDDVSHIGRVWISFDFCRRLPCYQTGGRRKPPIV